MWCEGARDGVSFMIGITRSSTTQCGASLERQLRAICERGECRGRITTACRSLRLQKPVCFDWFILDQVLVRPNLLPYFEDADVGILTQHRAERLSYRMKASHAATSLTTCRCFFGFVSEERM